MMKMKEILDNVLGREPIDEVEEKVVKKLGALIEKHNALAAKRREKRKCPYDGRVVDMFGKCPKCKETFYTSEEHIAGKKVVLRRRDGETTTIVRKDVTAPELGKATKNLLFRRQYGQHWRATTVREMSFVKPVKVPKDKKKVKKEKVDEGVKYLDKWMKERTVK